MVCPTKLAVTMVMAWYFAKSVSQPCQAHEWVHTHLEEFDRGTRIGPITNSQVEGGSLLSGRQGTRYKNRFEFHRMVGFIDVRPRVWGLGKLVTRARVFTGRGEWTSWKEVSKSKQNLLGLRGVALEYELVFTPARGKGLGVSAVRVEYGDLVDQLPTGRTDAGLPFPHGRRQSSNTALKYLDQGPSSEIQNHFSLPMSSSFRNLDPADEHEDWTEKTTSQRRSRSLMTTYNGFGDDTGTQRDYTSSRNQLRFTEFAQQSTIRFKSEIPIHSFPDVSSNLARFDPNGPADSNKSNDSMTHKTFTIMQNTNQIETKWLYPKEKVAIDCVNLVSQVN